MSGKPHIIKHNKTSPIPSRWLFVDVETMQTKVDDTTTEQEFMFCVSCFLNTRNDSPEVWVTHETIDDFWEYFNTLVHKGSKIVFIAHNSDFDFRVLKGFEYLHKYMWIPKLIIAESPPFILRFTHLKSSLEVLDTLNWFSTSLKHMGKMVGIEKQELPEYTDSRQVWINYCINDVMILKESWLHYLRFCKENDVGSFGRTRASQAYNWYRHTFMSHKIHIHKFEDVTKIERNSYFGGRTECFYIGEKKNEKHYYVDVNSMYPYVMKVNDYPTEFKMKLSFPDIAEVEDYITDYLLICEVLIHTDRPLYPKIHNKRLCFPVGRFWTTLSTPELKIALCSRHIEQVGKTCIYSKANIFDKWVSTLYSLRQKYKEEGNVTYEQFIKFLMNSLYGKFGQRNKDWNLVGFDRTRPDFISMVYDVETGLTYDERIINGFIYHSSDKHESADAFPAVCSHVTSYARVLLQAYIELCGVENVLYCDTDSLVVNQHGYDRLEHQLDNLSLGALKLEKTATYLDIRNLKDYTFGEISKTKGVKPGTVPITKGVYAVEQFEKFAGALRNSRINTVLVHSGLKHYTGEYMKGTVTDSGRVDPLELDITDYKEYVTNAVKQ